MKVAVISQSPDKLPFNIPFTFILNQISCHFSPEMANLCQITMWFPLVQLHLLNPDVFDVVEFGSIKSILKMKIKLMVVDESLIW